MRDIEDAMDQDPKAQSAFQTFAYGIMRHIGEHLAVLNSADLIAFTVGAGQYSSRLRKEILKDNHHSCIVFDQDKNQSIRNRD